jgi:CRISPR/Cas system-associated exonuclease Cas4 (RecB family)
MKRRNKRFYILLVCFGTIGSLISQNTSKISLSYRTPFSKRVIGLGYFGDSIAAEQININLHIEKGNKNVILKEYKLTDSGQDKILLLKVKELYNYIIKSGENYPGFHPHPGFKARFRYSQYYMWYKKPTENAPLLLSNIYPKRNYKNEEAYKNEKETDKMVKEIKHLVKKRLRQIKKKSQTN